MDLEIAMEDSQEDKKDSQEDTEDFQEDTVDSPQEDMLIIHQEEDTVVLVDQGVMDLEEQA